MIGRFSNERPPLPERRGLVTPVIKVQQRPPDPEPLTDHLFAAAAPVAQAEPEPAAADCGKAGV